MTSKSRGILVMLTVSGLIICAVLFPSRDKKLPPHHNAKCIIEKPHYHDGEKYWLDTVEVIEEDGVRWYTLDTIRP